MITHLFPDCRRSILGANFNYYPEPALHPDRIMEEHDLIYLMEGSWEICQDGMRYLIEPGDVLLLAAGRHHYGETPCQAGTRTMFLHMSAHPLDGQPGGALRIPVLTKAPQAHLGSRFRQLINVHWSDSPHREIRAAALLDLLLCDLALSEPHSSERWPVSAVRAILLSRPDVNFSVSALAAQLGVTERQLRYLFVNACGVAPHRYQLNLKLDMVRQLLSTEPGRTLSEIAETFGFSDEFHLSHAYKARFGHAPKADRKKP